mgnify:CR=1 FL=1|jgi:transcriptional regulator with XRE-family HTH domain
MVESRDIGQKLREARQNSKLTQEKIAEQLQVSRQTVSNWENNKSYPDIISLIKLGDIYNISLDMLLKGDDSMLKHLAQSTDTVTSNHKLILSFGLNILILLLFVVFNGIIIGNSYLFIACALLGLSTTIFLFYQIINKI